MHKLLTSVALLMLTPLTSYALNCAFTWNKTATRIDGTPVVVDGYRLYSRLQSTDTWAMKKDIVGADSTTADDVCVAGEQWTVRSYLGSLESENSNVVIIPQPLTPPAAFKVIVVIGVQ